MKYLSLIALSTFLPGLVSAHPGHDQSMTFVHSFEAIGIILATIVAAGLAIRYLTRHKD